MITPIQNPLAILDWIVSRHVHEYLDTAGRPVGEGRASAIREVRTELRPCPYSGSRHHHAKPMNASAIQAMPAWPELLEIMAWLSHRHRRRYGTRVTNSNDLGRITGAGVMLVDYLALRRDDRIGSAAVPLLISGVYKVCLGYQLAYLPERFADKDAPAQLPSPEGFLEYLESSGLLIGESEVCSCPPALILQSYEAMIRAPRDVSAPQLGVAIDWDRFDDFAEAAGDMWQEVMRFAILTGDLIPQIAHPEIPAHVRERLNARLHEQGSHVLAARESLVSAVAQSIRKMAGGPRRTLPPATQTPRKMPPGSVAAQVLAWLKSRAPDEFAAYSSELDGALQSQLGSYEAYESEVLKRINTALHRVMDALNLARGPEITESALTQICGSTLRDF